LKRSTKCGVLMGTIADIFNKKEKRWFMESLLPIYPILLVTAMGGTIFLGFITIFPCFHTSIFSLNI